MERITNTSNGIRIYDYCNTHLHSFCIGIYVRAGILFENGEHTGISHLWEHMVFKNINALLGRDMAKRLDQMGAYFNACTYKELVEFKIAAASKYYEECARMICRVFDEFAITEEEFETEKKRVKSEIREEDEKKSIDYQGNKRVWKGTSLEKSVAGFIRDVNRITLEDIKAYHREVCVADNIFVYVTGKYTRENMSLFREIIEEKHFYDGTLRNNCAPVPKKMFRRNATVVAKKSDVYEVRFSFDIDKSKCLQTEIDLLYSMMFSGESSKVFEELSDKTGLVYSYDSAMEVYENVGCMYFSYMVKGKNLKKSIGLVMKLICDMREDIESLLKLAKQPYLDNTELELDDAQGLNWMMAYESHVLGCGYKNIEERKKAYVSVTKERMLEVTKEVLQPDNMVVNIGSKKNKVKAEDIRGMLLQAFDK